jgi:hypothetical protein
MPRKRAKKASPRKPRRTTARRSGGTKRAEEKAFVKSLVAHGQAVAVPPGGKLPPGATHELVECDRGNVKVVRKRFSAI